MSFLIYFKVKVKPYFTQYLFINPRRRKKCNSREYRKVLPKFKKLMFFEIFKNGDDAPKRPTSMLRNFFPKR